MSKNTGEITAINGPIITVQIPEVRNGEQVRIGKLNLMGEVIRLDGNLATVQVY
ncbi:MAG: hypothetical protein IMF12_06535, partial [Proteobacteria bacterium]|nr:hypothetical protein [Pseudomonadota bacterium]